MSKLPITIITGFLGSGKTTLLQRIIEHKKSKRVLYLVNDFSPNSVDAELVDSDDLALKSITGGSIFCTCKITEFVEALNSIDTNSFEEVIIEASGISNPSSADTMLRDSGLDNSFCIKSIVCIVDSTNVLKLLDAFQFIQSQLCVGNLIILNKTDLVDKSTTTEITKVLCNYNPKASIVEATFSDIDLHELESSVYHTIVDKPIATKSSFYSYTIKSKRNIDLTKLETLLIKTPSIIRVKGFMNINGTMHYLCYSGSGLEASPTRESVKPYLEFLSSSLPNKKHFSNILLT